MHPTLAPLIAFAALATSALSAAEEAQKPASQLGVSCERLEVKRSFIADHNLTVTDWKIRLTNRETAPRWMAIVGTPTTSDYLKQRNPKQISYQVKELTGGSWTDTYKGYAVFLGAGAKWMKLAPGESLEFTAPISDGFKSKPTQLRLEFLVTADASGKDQKTLVSQTFTQEEPEDKKPVPSTRAK